MLYELAVADAYGIAFEFVKDAPSHGLINDLATYQQHPKYDGLKPSQYTDDTQRSMANAEVIIAGNWHSPSAFVASLQDCFRNDWRDGYSRRFQEYMERMVDEAPEDFLQGITQRATSNGSIMGSLPCGMLKTQSDVMFAATIQAFTTHSIMTAPYAQAMALSVYHFRHGGKIDDLAARLSQLDGDVILDAPPPARDSRSMEASRTAQTVLALVQSHRSLSSLLYDAVDLGGDTDSVAALSVGIASLSNEYVQDLPQVLIDGLEHGDPAKQDRLRKLDALLMTI